MHLNELKALHVSQLLEMAAGLEIENANRLRKQELMFIMKRAPSREQIFGDGVLEAFGFLRSPETSYLASTDDITSRRRRSAASTCTRAIRSKAKSARKWRALFRPGQGGQGQRRGARGDQASHHVREPDAAASEPDHAPGTRHQERGKPHRGRILDVFAPIGMGQRGLIVASPKSGKTVMMQHRARHHLSRRGHDRAAGGRASRVTEMQRTVRGEVVASTFDERPPPACKWLKWSSKGQAPGRNEEGCWTRSRLARYNTVVPASGMLTGGVDANALQPRRASSAPPAISRKAVR